MLHHNGIQAGRKWARTDEPSHSAEAFVLPIIQCSPQVSMGQGANFGTCGEGAVSTRACYWPGMNLLGQLPRIVCLC